MGYIGIRKDNPLPYSEEPKIFAGSASAILVADVVGRTYHEAQHKPPYHIRTWVRQGRLTAGGPSRSPKVLGG